MKPHELPYFTRFFEAKFFSPELIGNGSFVDNYVRRAQDEPQWALSLMQMMLHRGEEARQGWLNLIADNRLLNRHHRYMMLAEAMSDALCSYRGVMLPYVAHKIETDLRVSHSLSRLCRVIQLVGEGYDKDDCIDMLEQELDLVRCEDCDELEYADYTTSAHLGNDIICRDCIENGYTHLDRYDQYVANDCVRSALDADGDSTDIHYEDSSFRYDVNLNTYVHVDYEDDDDEEEEEPTIKAYHSSKRMQRPIEDDWSRQNRRFFGVELEVEYHGTATAEDKAHQLNMAINNGLYGRSVFFERDGSVPQGFEVISQPMSLPAQRQLWSWLNNKDLTKHLKSHNTGTCGLHVHVTRRGLTPLQVAKIVAFINAPDNESLIRAIARRYAEGYCRIKDKSKLGQAHQSEDRYEAVNVTSSKTIEFRLFKGSLKYESVIAALEFANALVEFTRPFGDCSARNLKADAFMEFINNKFKSETKVLRAYVNNRLEIA